MVDWNSRWIIWEAQWEDWYLGGRYERHFEREDRGIALEVDPVHVWIQTWAKVAAGAETFLYPI